MGDNTIKDFWQQKHNYNDINVLKQKMEEYYTDEFINNYNKWYKNLSDLNNTVYEFFDKDDFPQQHIKEIKYDWFCKNIINSIKEWIDVHGNIFPEDIFIITENIISDHVALCIHDYQKRYYTLPNLLQSIKNSMIL